MSRGHSTSSASDPWDLQPADLDQLRRQQTELLLIDCRTRVEFEHGHLQGAQCFPLQETSIRISELDLKKDQRIVVYCNSGRRSLIFVKYLSMRGFSDARSLAGGLEAYATECPDDAPC